MVSLIHRINNSQMQNIQPRFIKRISWKRERFLFPECDAIWWGTAVVLSNYERKIVEISITYFAIDRKVFSCPIYTENSIQKENWKPVPNLFSVHFKMCACFAICLTFINKNKCPFQCKAIQFLFFEQSWSTSTPLKELAIDHALFSSKSRIFTTWVF